MFFGFRFISALACSGPVAIGGGIVADVTTPQSRANPWQYGLWDHCSARCVTYSSVTCQGLIREVLMFSRLLVPSLVVLYHKISVSSNMHLEGEPYGGSRSVGLTLTTEGLAMDVLITHHSGT